MNKTTNTKMKRYDVSAEVTISISKTIVAESKSKAIEAASILDMPQLCCSCSTSDSDCWDIGDIDGEANDIKCEASHE